MASSLTLRSCVWHLLVWVTLISFETIVVPSFEHSKQNFSSWYPNIVSLEALIYHGLSADIEIAEPAYASPQLGPLFKTHFKIGQFMISWFLKKLSQDPDPIISEGEVELNSNFLYVMASPLTLSCWYFLHLLVWVTLISFETIVVPSFEHSKQNFSSWYPNIVSLEALIYHGLSADNEIVEPAYASPQLGPLFKTHF